MVMRANRIKGENLFNAFSRIILLNVFNYKVCKGTRMQNSELTRNLITNMNTTQKITSALYETSVNKRGLPRCLCSDEPNFRKWTSCLRNLDIHKWFLSYIIALASQISHESVFS